MPRTARTIEPGLPHHVILRGNNRRRLFSYAADYTRFIWYLARAARRTQVRVHGLSLMANHVHLIVTPADAGVLARLVKLTAQRYAQVRNLRRGGSGKLFEERYRCTPILSDEQLAATTAYVDLNAYRARLVADPAAHRWSTFRLHAGLPRSAVPGSLWTPSPWYLTLGATPAARAEAYRTLAAHRAAEYRAAQGTTRHVAPAQLRYTLRLERPDRTRATDNPAPSYQGAARRCPTAGLLRAGAARAKARARGRRKYRFDPKALRGRNVSPSW